MAYLYIKITCHIAGLFKCKVIKWGRKSMSTLCVNYPLTNVHTWTHAQTHTQTCRDKNLDVALAFVLIFMNDWMNEWMHEWSVNNRIGGRIFAICMGGQLCKPKNKETNLHMCAWLCKYLLLYKYRHRAQKVELP